MKKIYIYFLLFFTFAANAQSPQGISYQAVARDSTSKLLSNQPIKIKFTIRDSVAIGNIVYQEMHFDTTDAMGLFDLVIGQGIALNGNFEQIDWGKNNKFLQVDIDANIGTYINMGVQKMMSVPYALYAGSAGSVTNNSTKTIVGSFDKEGNIIYGEGFTVRKTNVQYVITFKDSFINTPVFVANVSTNSASPFQVNTTQSNNKYINIELGRIASNTYINSPKKIDNSIWSEIAAGGGGNSVLAIKKDGTLWGWGEDNYIFGGAKYYIPTNFSTVDNCTKISKIGNAFLVISNNSIFTWGSGSSNYLLGTQSTNDVKNPTNFISNYYWKVAKISSNKGLAIDTAGNLYTWGGTSSYLSLPNTDTDWNYISAGYRHQMALKTIGTLWVSGENQFGQLGTGNNNQSNTFIKVGTDTDWMYIPKSMNFTSFGIKKNGTLWGWGLNDYGQLGDSTKTNRNAPVKIGNDSNWAKVENGDQFTIGLKLDGTLWAWGGNNRGQLGDGTILDKNYPIQIGNDHDWSDISAGSSASYAIKKDGSLWAWGDNNSGQLGTGVKGTIQSIYLDNNFNNISFYIQGLRR